MTYMVNKYEPLLFGRYFAYGNKGTASPGPHPAWYTLGLPLDVKVGDKIHVYYMGHLGAVGTATIGFTFAKANLTSAGDFVIDKTQYTSFSTAKTANGDTAMTVNAPGSKTGKATLTLDDETASWAQGMTKDGDATYTISSNVVTVSSTAHGLNNGEYVYIRDPAASPVTVSYTHLTLPTKA